MSWSLLNSTTNTLSTLWDTINRLFLKILNMSLAASIIILVVLLARLLLRKMPKVFSYILWSVVLFRLLCPASISTDFSLFRAMHTPVTESGQIEYITFVNNSRSSAGIHYDLDSYLTIIQENGEQNLSDNISNGFVNDITSADNNRITSNQYSAGDSIRADTNNSDNADTTTSNYNSSGNDTTTSNYSSDGNNTITSNHSSDGNDTTTSNYSSDGNNTITSSNSSDGNNTITSSNSFAGNVDSNSSIIVKTESDDSSITKISPSSSSDFFSYICFVEFLNSMQLPIPVLTGFWLCGFLVLLIYSVIQFFLLHHKLIGAVPLQKNIYLADHITSPFVMGLLRPRIYLPSALTREEYDYIVLHEQHHIHRGDHVIKLLAFLALCLHWFNPFVWLAFSLSSKDMEMSCDEAVLQKMDSDIRADYSTSLLRFASGRKLSMGTPLSFGESDTKDRVKNIMKYKKPAFWTIIAAIVFCGVVGMTCLTNPKKENQNLSEKQALNVSSDSFNKYNLLENSDASEEDTPFESLDASEENAPFESLDASEKDMPFGNSNTSEEDESSESSNILLYHFENPLADTSLIDHLNDITKDPEDSLSESFVTYRYNDDSDWSNFMQPAIQLDVQKNTFQFQWSLLSSYISWGTYQLDDEELILTDPYGGYTYVFKVNYSEDSAFASFLFDKAQSSWIPEYRISGDSYETASPVPDGAKFVLDLEEVYASIESLLTIISTPSVSSNPADSIAAHPDEYKKLVGYNEFTLHYCFSRFLEGGQTDLKGHIMANACEDIMLNWNEGYLSDGVSETGQEWFDGYKNNVLSLKQQYDEADLKKYYPAAAFLLNMIDK